MSDPFQSATVEAPACPTTFQAPSASAMLDTNAEWAKTGCSMTIEVPVGGKATVSSKAVEKALAASIGSSADDGIVITPTGYTVVGSHSCNPTGVAVGLRFEDSDNLAHVHVGSNAENPEHFAAVLSSRYHSDGDFPVAISASKGASQQSVEERVEIAQKWAGVRQEDLLEGVQQMVSKRADGQAVTSFAVPLMITTGEQAEDGVAAVKQQPLAWAIERNQGALGDSVTIASMPTAQGLVTDHFLVGAKDMESIVGATTQAVWGSRKANDITISAKPLGRVTGDSTVTVGLRVEADVLSLSV